MGKVADKVKTAMAFRNQRGVALILVLWITMLLMVLAGGFISMVRTEAQSVGNYREEVQAYYLARSGLNLAVDKILEGLFREEGVQGDVERWIADGRPYTVSIGSGSAEVRIFDEYGKMDLNKATRSDLVRVFAALEIEGAEKDIIVDSILDWVDENNFHRINGAEDDYYGSLPEPYGAKDGPMDTVEELLWVKGVSPELFYGEGRPAGLAGAFTVYTGSNRVNVNTASFEILMSLPGMHAEGALRIIESREVAKFQGAGELARAGVKLAPEITKLISFTSSGIYTIEATGSMPESPATRTVKAVVKIRGKSRYRILYWKDQALAGSGLI